MVENDKKKRAKVTKSKSCKLMTLGFVPFLFLMLK